MASSKLGNGLSIVIVLMASFLWKSVFAEEKPTAEGVSMAATLIGAISFVMCLYYFINYPDKDIKQMSWQTISGTISIFCAVLAFSSINDLMGAYVTTPIFGEGDATMGALLVDVLHMIAWFAMMQYFLAKMSGAIDSDAEQEKRKALQETDEDAFDAVLFKKKENMACFAVLLAHITGFASINCFGTVQQIFFSSSPAQAFLTPLCALIFMLIIQRLTDSIRESVSLGDDGAKDEFEDLWDEQCEDAENDVMGLALSFTFVSAMRFAITGCLPNQEGKEEECTVEEYLYKHTLEQKLQILGAGVVFSIVIFIMRMNWPEWLEEAEEEEEEENGTEEEMAAAAEAKKTETTDTAAEKAMQKRIQFYGRFAEGIYVSTSMCFSWSFFFGTQMVLAGYSFFQGEEEMMAVALALLLSAICLGGIIPMDWLADQDWTDEHCDNAIRSLMQSMAILIGFSWEQCFDASVDQIAERTDEMGIHGLNTHTVKAGLTLFCCILLIPAWKMYMIPFMVAEGWNYSFPLKIQDIKTIAQQMAGVPEDIEEEEYEHEEQSTAEAKKTLKKIEKLKASLANLNSVVDVHAINSGMVAAGDYQALAGDDKAALKKQNADLRAEADRANAACLKAQKMLDATMANMLSSMQQMNETMGRIESTA